MTYLISTDIGTKGIKTALTDKKGNARFATYKEYIINLHLGWATQLPEIRAQAACGS